MWDSGAAGDNSDLNSEENDSQDGIEKLDEIEADEFYTYSQDKYQNEANFKKSLNFLEECSFIDFVDTNGEFIITAGRDHDIKIWDAETEEMTQRLVGHAAPITGLTLLGTDPLKSCSSDLTVISSSEDGSIREWSIKKGKEIRKIETENIITCLGIMPNKLAAIGNHKGHLDVHQLSTGQLYCTIVAHEDPIDSLMVNDVHICTVVYDRPGSLRVWQVKWGKLICMYSLEDTFSIEFKAFTMYGDLLFLGDASKQKLHILSYMTEDITDILQLNDEAGYVQHVAVIDGLVLVSTVDNNKMVHLHVYQLQDFNHLGSIQCENMDRITSIALVRNPELKFILGGSALAVLKLEFPPRKESVDSSSKSLNQQENLKKNETLQESTDANHLQGSDILLRDKNVDETHKSQNIRDKRTVIHQKQLPFQNFPHLPPIVKSKFQDKKGDPKSKQPESEYYWTENAHKHFDVYKQEGMQTLPKLKENIQQESIIENSALIEEFEKLDLDTSKDQGDVQLDEMLLEKQQRNEFNDLIVSNEEKDIKGETSGRKYASKQLQERISQTLTQKQKYISENVRIVKVDKKKDDSKKHWFDLSKKKQQSAGKTKQKKEKNCDIM